MEQKPLEGILVVAVEQAVAAPLCTCRLADAGARVIKVERPTGDFARSYDTAVHGEASYFVWINRGKESVVLDLKQRDDADLLQRILARADIFVQNLAPGAAARLDIDAATLRTRFPRLITCDIAGYGDGPCEEMKAYDFLIQCESGLVALSGGRESYGRIGVSVCDIGAGINAYSAILQALLLRSRTGTGSAVQVSLFDTAAEWMAVPLLHHMYGGTTPQRAGMSHPSIAPYGAYPTREGAMIVIAIQNEREWARFCEQILGDSTLVDDPRYATNTARVADRSRMDTVIRAAFGRYTRSELVDRLSAAEIACGAVNSVADLAAHPQLRMVPMQAGGADAQMVASALRTAQDPGIYPPVPRLGEHSVQIRKEFAG